MNPHKTDGFPPHLQLQLSDSERRKQIRKLPSLIDDLPEPMSCESVRRHRKDNADKAKAWVITDEMVVEAYRAPTKEEKIKQRKVRLAEEAKANPKLKRPRKGKLSEDDIRSIRKSADEGISNKILSEEHNVTIQCIWNIVNRKTWQHVE